MVKHEPEIRRAKANHYAASCNSVVHEAPWTRGRTKGLGAGGLYQALELAQLACEAHGLPYEPGLSRIEDYDPRRFMWLCHERGEADICVEVLDTETGKLAIWPHWAG